MRLNWHCLRLAGVSLMLVLVAGCSGINASHSVSPATFLLPGLMHNAPSQTTPVQLPESPGTDASLAQAQ